MCGVRCVWGKWSGPGDGTTATSITAIDKVQITWRERIIESKRWQNAHFKFNHILEKTFIIFLFTLFFLFYAFLCLSARSYDIYTSLHSICILYVFNWLSCTLYLCLSCYTIFICKYILGYVMKMDQWTPNCTWRRPAEGGAQVSLLEIACILLYFYLFI